MGEVNLSFRQVIARYQAILGRLKKSYDAFNLQNQHNGNLSFDFLATGLLSLFWLWFAWQYGFYNSPDSWYRGVLGKSLAEGHPYFINLKQGWLYNYGPWHHDVTHEPLLPLLYAGFFLVFGNKIIIANFISVLSAGILIFPLLRISRKIIGSPWPAFFTYLIVVCNKELAYLFEVTAGLSLPTTLLAIAAFAFFLLKVIETKDKRWMGGAVVSLVSFYLVRSDSQLIFFWLMFWSWFFGRQILSREAFRRVFQVWGWSLLLVLPWFIRKLILFGNPFFSHITPMFWTDRGYDYWTYHESIPLPGPRAYFSTHSLSDFLNKICVGGPSNFYAVFQKVVLGPLWLYLMLFFPAAAYIYRRSNNTGKYIFITLWMIFMGYVGVYSLVPVLEVRYIIPVYFILFFTLITAFFLFCGDFIKNKFIHTGIIVVFILLTLVLFPWKDLHFSYRTSDAENRCDVLVNSLREKVSRDDVILGPFADVQRLAFATGLTFIEEPDNLKNLVDPEAFFRKYNIRYSLVDVGKILPEEMIESVGIVGDRLLYGITYETGAVSKRGAVFEARNLLENRDIQAAIADGIRKRMIYIDALHADEPGDLSVFKDVRARAYIAYGDFVSEKDKLFQCGLLLMRYAMKKKELSAEEDLILKKYIANGGRVLLLCPSWVWVGYEHKGLGQLSYNHIAKEFDLFLGGDYVAPPLKLTDKNFYVPGFESEINATFSAIVQGASGTPMLKGSDGKIAAISARKGKAKIIIWAQNNLLGELSLKPAGRQFTLRVINWLLAR